MDPRSTEGGGKALVLLQVGQPVIVELHGLAGKPAAEFVDALLHPAREASVEAAAVGVCLVHLHVAMDTHLLINLCRRCM